MKCRHQPTVHKTHFYMRLYDSAYFISLDANLLKIRKAYVVADKETNNTNLIAARMYNCKTVNICCLPFP